LRGPLQRFPKVLRYVELNHFCHDNLLDPSESRCARRRQIVRSSFSVAISAGATFIAAMIRTSCSVKPRVVIFHKRLQTSNQDSTEACLRDKSAITCVWGHRQIVQSCSGYMVQAEACTSRSGSIHTFGGFGISARSVVSAIHWHSFRVANNFDAESLRFPEAGLWIARRSAKGSGLFADVSPSDWPILGLW
jgi:hypothetical protein